MVPNGAPQAYPWLTSCGFTLSQVAPVYEGVRLRVGDALLLQAAADMTGARLNWCFAGPAACRLPWLTAAAAAGTPVAELKKWATKDGTPINSVWSHFTK